MKRTPGIVALVVVGLLCLGTTSARAETGLLLAPEKLEAAARKDLEAKLRAAHTAHPLAFGQLKEICARLPALDARKRGPLAPVTSLLRAMGPDGLWPMLELTAFSAPLPPLSTSARRALEIGLLEALGALRSPAAAPVLFAVLDGSQTFEQARAAAEAVGKLGTDEAAKKLVALSQGTGVQQEGALAGMGSCRRSLTSQTLARALASHPEPERAKLLVRALAEQGSAWAWKTGKAGPAGEALEIRSRAAEALLNAYLGYDGEVRQAASNALVVVNAPNTAALIASARTGAGREQFPALDALGTRVEKSRVP